MKQAMNCMICWKRKKKEALKIALLYYSYINDKDSTFLEAHDYDRDEIKSDLKESMTQEDLDTLKALYEKYK